MKSKVIAWGLGGLMVAGVAGSAHGALLYATNGTSITRFDEASPTVVTNATVNGLQAGETLVGIDVRPSGGGLYGVGSTSRVYTIDPLTGLAVQSGALLSTALNGTKFGVDFNPVPDRLRITSDTEQNLRVNAATGATTVDTALNPVGNVVEVAYSNNVNGATSTTLYGIDSAAGTLVNITVPNGGGPITSVGSLGLGTDLSPNIGFDITPAGKAYASITAGGTTRLYSVNLTSGTATVVGSIGAGSTAFIGLTAVPEPASFGLIGMAAAGLLMRRRRHA